MFSGFFVPIVTFGFFTLLFMFLCGIVTVVPIHLTDDFVERFVTVDEGR